MKNILEICQEAAKDMELNRPQNLFNKNNLYDSTYLYIAEDTLNSISRYGAWEELIKSGEIVTDPKVKEYSIYEFYPDFYYLQNTIYIKNYYNKVICALTPDLYKNNDGCDIYSTDLKMQIKNGRIILSDKPEQTLKFIFNYYSNNVVYDSQDGFKEKNKITKNTDVPIFDEYLVKKGIIWRYKYRNKLSFETDYNEYERLIKERFFEQWLH